MTRKAPKSSNPAAVGAVSPAVARFESQVGGGSAFYVRPFARHTMKRTIAITIVIAAIVAAAAAVWFWALRPLGFASYLSSTGATDADIIRQYWPHRLVEPEWVSTKPDRLMNWHLTETIARLSVLGVSWFTIAGGAVFRFKRRWRLRPTRPHQRTRPSRSACRITAGAMNVAGAVHVAGRRGFGFLRSTALMTSRE
jgi:hypothetical protein